MEGQGKRSALAVRLHCPDGAKAIKNKKSAELRLQKIRTNYKMKQGGKAMKNKLSARQRRVIAAGKAKRHHLKKRVVLFFYRRRNEKTDIGDSVARHTERRPKP